MAVKHRPSRRGGPGGVRFLLYGACLIIGLILGSMIGHAITQEDGFALIGGQSVTLTVGDDPEWVDPGASLRRFGLDFSDRVRVQTDLPVSEDESEHRYRVDTSKPGSYFIRYTADVWGYRNVNLIRTVRVVDSDAKKG